MESSSSGVKWRLLFKAEADATPWMAASSLGSEARARFPRLSLRVSVLLTESDGAGLTISGEGVSNSSATQQAGAKVSSPVNKGGEDVDGGPLTRG